MMEEQTKFTFDNVVRGILWAIVLTGIVMLLNRLSSVLVPFFLAWLIAYLLFPLVKFFQYRCKMKYRILGILCAFLVTGLVLTGFFLLIIPPMVEESMRVKDLLVEYVTTVSYSNTYVIISVQTRYRLLLPKMGSWMVSKRLFRRYGMSSHNPSVLSRVCLR